MKHLKIIVIVAQLMFVSGLIAEETTEPKNYTFEGHFDKVNIGKLVIGISSGEFRLSPIAKAYNLNNTPISLLSIKKFTPIQVTMLDKRVVKIKILPAGYPVKNNID